MSVDPVLHPGIKFLNQASSFEHDSYPIEVGFSGCDMASTSFLVATRGRLAGAGRRGCAARRARLLARRFRVVRCPARDLARALNVAFRGDRLFSARHDWDRFWLRRLHRAAGGRQEYDVMDWFVLFRELLWCDLRTGDGVDRLPADWHV